jgi:hypothetical protein
MFGRGYSHAQQVGLAPTPCPYCGSTATVFWSQVGAFVQKTKCGGCHRETVPVRCGHDQAADTTDRTANERADT